MPTKREFDRWWTKTNTHGQRPLVRGTNKYDDLSLGFLQKSEGRIGRQHCDVRLLLEGKTPFLAMTLPLSHEVVCRVQVSITVEPVAPKPPFRIPGKEITLYPLTMPSGNANFLLFANRLKDNPPLYGPRTRRYYILPTVLFETFPPFHQQFRICSILPSTVFVPLASKSPIILLYIATHPPQ